MTKAVSFILCSEDQWEWNDEFCGIKFDNNNIGLSYGYGPVFFILSEFEWKAIESLEHDKTAGASPINSDEEPQLLGQLTLEITLTKRLPSYVIKSKNPDGKRFTNESCLKDEAFRPKLLTVRIEQGNFVLPARIGQGPYEIPHGIHRYYDPRSAMRIVFDSSPYPPANKWKEAELTEIFGEFTPLDGKEFTGRTVKELEGKGRAFNDVPANSCAVS